MHQPDGLLTSPQEDRNRFVSLTTDVYRERNVSFIRPVRVRVAYLQRIERTTIEAT